MQFNLKKLSHLLGTNKTVLYCNVTYHQRAYNYVHIDRTDCYRMYIQYRAVRVHRYASYPMRPDWRERPTYLLPRLPIK